MERKKRSKGSVWEFCYANKIFGTYGFEIRALGQKLVKFCAHTHKHTHTHTTAAKLVVRMSISATREDTVIFAESNSWTFWCCIGAYLKNARDLLWIMVAFKVCGIVPVNIFMFGRKSSCRQRLPNNVMIMIQAVTTKMR